MDTSYYRGVKYAVPWVPVVYYRGGPVGSVLGTKLNLEYLLFIPMECVVLGVPNTYCLQGRKQFQGYPLFITGARAVPG